MIKIAKILAFLALLWIVAGLALEPAWWYSLLFEGKYVDVQYWWSGTYIAIWKYGEIVLYFALLVGVILALSRTSVPDRLQRASASFWEIGVVGERFVAMVLVALAIIVAGVFSLDLRNRQHFSTWTLEKWTLCMANMSPNSFRRLSRKS